MLAPREFKQRRSAATYEALLQAAARVFARLGFEAAQTPEIAAEAGVSTGAFYRYFTDKRAVFVEVVAQHLRQSQEEVMARLTPERFVGDGTSSPDKRRAIDLVLDVLFDRIKRDAELERVYLSMSYSDPDVRTLRAQYEDEGCQALAKLIEVITPRDGRARSGGGGAGHRHHRRRDRGRSRRAAAARRHRRQRRGDQGGAARDAAPLPVPRRSGYSGSTRAP